MNPDNLINWGELSRLLAGSRSVITKKRIGKKHIKSVEDLKNVITKWYESLNCPQGQKPEINKNA